PPRGSPSFPYTTLFRSGQVVGRVMEQVAEHGPQELRLRVRALAQRGKLRHRVLRLQDLDHLRRRSPVRGTVVLLLQVQDQDVLADRKSTRLNSSHVKIS